MVEVDLDPSIYIFITQQIINSLFVFQTFHDLLSLGCVMLRTGTILYWSGNSKY